MLHQILFLALYLGLMPLVLIFPFTGVLIYYWLEDLPPDQVYSATLLSGYLSFAVGALAFFVWLVREKKTIPRPLLVTLLMAALLVWVNVTSFYALVPSAVAFKWDRTVKVIGFAILASQMLSTRARIEAFVWVFVLSAAYFAIPGAIKVIISGGSGGIGTGEVVVGAEGSFFGDRVVLSIVMAMALPLALYLGRQSSLLPPRLQRWTKPAMLGVAAAFLIALIGTFARTALLAGGATLLMMTVRSRRKLVALLVASAAVLALLAIAPDNWYARMDTIIHYHQDNSAVDRIAAWKWAWSLAREHPIFGGGFGVFRLDAGSIPGRPGWLEAHNIFFSMMGEQGFVGLGIFCTLIIAIYRSCAVIQKRARGREGLLWAADLARATQIALVAYIVGGSFVSISTESFLYMLGAITVGTRGLIERELNASVRKRSVQPLRAAPQPAE